MTRWASLLVLADEASLLADDLASSLKTGK